MLLYSIQDRSLSEHQQQRSLRIGYAIEPPYSFVTETGQVSGLLPTLAKKVAQDLGITQIEWIQVSTNELIPGLEQGRFDLIATGMYITRERAQIVAFSDPVVCAQPELLILPGATLTIDALPQQAPTDLKIAVVQGSAEATQLERMGIPIAQLLLVADPSMGYKAVAAGLADGFARSAPTIRWLIDQQPAEHLTHTTAFRGSAAPSALEYIGFAFRRSDQQLLPAWNRAQQRYITHPSYQQMLGDFGFIPTESPGSITTKELLQWD
ncbi:MAG: ectoine/hydroxyectoine ABC transporter substrate-binding protein EhuB [Roseiflexaceae bacterium]